MKTDFFKRLVSASWFMSMLLVWFVSLVILVQGCGGGGPASYVPPDLKTNLQQVIIQNLAVSPKNAVAQKMPSEGTVLGYLFTGSVGEHYNIVLTRTSGDDIPALSLYQFSQDGWGQAIAWATVDAGIISISDWVVETSANYLALVDVVQGDRTGTFSLEVECTQGCAFSPQCNTDGDCPPGFACSAGICVETNPGCRSNADCPSGTVCVDGQCFPAGQGGAAGDLCDSSHPCLDGLNCLQFIENRGYCAGSCDCNQGSGCEAPAQCMWGDGQSCWCGYSCQNATDCPNGGAGWTCYDVGTAMGADAFWACLPFNPDEVPTCNVNSDCPEGYLCINGRCFEQTPDCRFDTDCPPGYVCEAGSCVEQMPACQSDRECPPGFQCLAGVCVEQTPNCRTDEDCPPGFVCECGYCVPQPACAGDDQCPPGTICQAGECVPGGPGGAAGDFCDAANPCSTGLECLMADESHGYCAGLCDCNQGSGCQAPSQCLWGDGQTCWCGYTCQTNADCPNGGAGWTCYDIGSAMGSEPFLACLPFNPEELPMCESDNDCPPGFACMDGTCVEQYPECQSNAECPPGFVCLEGNCVEQTPSCRSNADCPPGFSCVNGNCVPEQPQCGSDADCETGLVCVNGQCVASGSGGVAGDLCDPARPCIEGLECRMFDEIHGYCAASCDCTQGSGCEAPAECLWSDGQSCWCGYTCRTSADCPDGGAGWTCFDIGTAIGSPSYLVCIPLEMNGQP